MGYNKVVAQMCANANAKLINDKALCTVSSFIWRAQRKTNKHCEQSENCQQFA